MTDKSELENKAVEQESLEDKSAERAAEENQPEDGADESDAPVESDEEVDEEAAAHEAAKREQYDATSDLAGRGGDTSKSHRKAVAAGETEILPYEQA